MDNAEHTLIIAKPDAVKRGLIGSVIKRIERTGLRVVTAEMMRIPAKIASAHYQEHKKEKYYGRLIGVMTGSKSLVMVVSGEGAIGICRKLIGSTFCVDALPGTIRGDFGLGKGAENLVHGSDSIQSANREIQLFFPDFCFNEKITDSATAEEVQQGAS